MRTVRATALAALVALGGCAPEPPPDPRRPPTPARWDGRHPGAHLWSAALLRILHTSGRPLLDLRPTDMPAFCPRYEALPPEGRAAVWLMLFSAIAEKESGFRPNHTHREAFTDAGRPVISRGLLQTSFESTRHYGCDHASPADTHEPVRNLSCGVRIMTHHVRREPRIGGTAEAPDSGGARYWAVLRPGHRERPLELIQANTAAHPLCR